MNIKAERIEQMVQIINRNLQLIYCGQQQGIVPLEVRQLQKVDTVIFGHDKFAFEMVHFVKSAAENFKADNNLTTIWEQNFVHGLETLLVECAIVSDDIERDCFVSRVYCWFTEKLSERRELPRQKAYGTGNLKSSVRALQTDSFHTVKGLEHYDPGRSLDALVQSRNQQTFSDTREIVDADDRDLPSLAMPDTISKFGARKVPLYVKHGFPAVLQSKCDSQVPTHQSQSFLPKIPGAAENYGMVYNAPETEAEKTMHELWLARRRQEAFEWKTQQHLSLVMDRLALHKSRLESDALRRTESGSMLKMSKQRPASAGDTIATGGRTRSPVRPSTERSAHRHGHSPSPRKQNQRSTPSHLRPHNQHHSDTDDNASQDSRATTQHQQSHQPPHVGVAMTAADRANVVTNLTVLSNGMETEAAVSRPSRVSVMTPAKANSRKEHLPPMRFKMDLPDSFSVVDNCPDATVDVSTHQFYMQLSDSDDDDRPDRPALKQHITAGRAGTSGTAAGSAKVGPAKKRSGTAGKPVNAQFKHERPIVRERPQSAKLFRSVATADPELKVHYRHTNFRRMPLTVEQEQWLEERETARAKKSVEAAQKLVEAVQAKLDKKKNKGAKDKGKESGGGKKKDKDKKGAAASALAAAEKPKCKYENASQFMSEHFPNFEGGGEDDDDPDCVGPMRAVQLVEVARVMDAFEEFGMGGAVKESALRKALIIPQDRPEALCLENLRETAGEGLMANPLPKEFWRAFVMSKKKGGKKKRSRK